MVFTIAVGVEDRPWRFHTPAKFFVQLGDTLNQFGVKSYYIHHPDVRLKTMLKRRATSVADHETLRQRLLKIRPRYMFVWNGNCQGDEVSRAVARELGIQSCFAEIGWFPQSETIYFDWEGTNFRSSIRSLDLAELDPDPRIDSWVSSYIQERACDTVTERDYLFVPLQDENDTNITDASPYQRMNDFVRDLSERFPDERIIVRRHPRFMQVEMAAYQNVEYRNDGDIYDWLRHSKGIVGINSTVLLEGLLYDRPIYAVGESLASGLGVYLEYPTAKAITLTENVDEVTRRRRRALLSELVFKRMMRREDLDDAQYISNYFVFREMIETLTGKPLKQS